MAIETIELNQKAKEYLSIVHFNDVRKIAYQIEFIISEANGKEINGLMPISELENLKNRLYTYAEELNKLF